MGLTFVDIVIRKTADSSDAASVTCLVDSGAIYTIVPGDLLRSLAIEEHDAVDFELADGTKITRQTGWMFVEFGQRFGYSPVVFGEPGDSELLGAFTLEALRLWLDPVHRTLNPLKMTL
jgi:predicted aspartyl protease